MNMVSVIIPNYNHAPYLKERIDSVLNQTFLDFELIILDDNSADHSKDIIEEYRENTHITQIIYNDENSGSTFRQWEKGISAARGKYIWIAESDDVAMPGFLERMVAKLESDNLVLCMPRSYIIDDKSNILHERFTKLEAKTYNSKTFAAQHLLFENNIYNASMAVFRKDCITSSIWEKISKFKYCGDWLFWADLIIESNKKVCVVDEYLNLYRTHSVNVTNKSQKQGLNFLEGFPISKYIACRLNIKRDKRFCFEWYIQWLELNKTFKYPKSVNKKIWTMFFKEQPFIILFAVVNFFKRYKTSNQ